MSDSLNTLTSLVGNSTLGQFVIDQLSVASWRGIPFYMPSQDEVDGQRVVRFRYPGSTRKDFQWLGPLDGPIHVTGLLIGDDANAQAARMRQANLAAGPGTLVHPWLGTFQAVLMDEGMRIATSEQEFRVARLDATFERYDPPVPPTPDWFGQLQDSVNSLMAQARAMLAAAVGLAAVPLALFGFAMQLINTAEGVWTGLCSGPSGSAAQQVLAEPIADLAAAAPTPDSTFGGAVADLLAVPAIAVANAGTPAATPAVAAATADTTVADTLAPDAAAALLLQAVAGLAPALPPPVAAAGVIVLAAQLQVAAQAAAVGATIPFVSSNDAITWQIQIDGVLSGLQIQAGVLAASLPLVAGPARRAIGAFRVAVSADIAARAVNLPGLASVTTDRTLNAWRIALAVVGDTPELMTGVVVDLWRRSGVHNPAAMPAGTYAYLP